MTQRTKSAKPRALTQFQLRQELYDLIDICFVGLDDLCMKEISNLTHLSTSTLYNLKKHKFSPNVRFRTIQALAAAANLKITVTAYEVTVVLVDRVS